MINNSGFHGKKKTQKSASSCPFYNPPFPISPTSPIIVLWLSASFSVPLPFLHCRKNLLPRDGKNTTRPGRPKVAAPWKVLRLKTNCQEQKTNQPKIQFAKPPLSPTIEPKLSEKKVRIDATGIGHNGSYRRAFALNAKWFSLWGCFRGKAFLQETNEYSCSKNLRKVLKMFFRKKSQNEIRQQRRAWKISNSILLQFLSNKKINKSPTRVKPPKKGRN